MNCDCSDNSNNPVNNMLNNINNQNMIPNNMGNLSMNNMNSMSMNNMNNVNSINNNLNNNLNMSELNNLGNFGNVGNNVGKGTSVDLIRNMDQQNQQILSLNQPSLNNKAKINNNSNNSNNSFVNNVSENISNDIDNVYHSSIHLLHILVLLIVGLSWHEVIKIYITHAIKFNRGSTKYFLYYALASTILAVSVITYYRNNKKSKN